MHTQRKKILSLLADVTDREIDELADLPEESGLAELGLDSLQFIEFIVEMENEFHIEVDDQDLYAENYDTLGSLFSTLDQYLETAQPSETTDCSAADRSSAQDADEQTPGNASDAEVPPDPSVPRASRRSSRSKKARCCSKQCCVGDCYSTEQELPEAKPPET